MPSPIVEFISRNYGPEITVEVGIGKRWDVATQLSRAGFRVIATDIIDLAPRDFEFIKDDITDPRMSVYRDANLIYSIRPPPELFSSIISVAKSVGADCLIRPLGNEFPEGGELVNYKEERFYLWKFGE